MKKLLVVVGAGASIDFGMPSVAKIDSLFESWSKGLCPLYNDPSKSLYSWVKEEISKYVEQKPEIKENVINFENLLFVLQTLASFEKDESGNQFRNRVSPFIELKKFPEILSPDGKSVKAEYLFSYLSSELIYNLLDLFRNKCNTLTQDKENQIKILKIFFDNLTEDFDLGFINLNYDNVILTALSNLETGFDKITGQFIKEKIYNNKWNFCYHLHGSVHFDGRNNKSIIGNIDYEIQWKDDLSTSHFGRANHGYSYHTSEGLTYVQSPIIAGLDKTNQILQQPFNSYYMQLDRLIYESDAVLMLGYGFGDLHLNKCLEYIAYDTNKKRKVVMVDWYTESDNGASYWRNYLWEARVAKTMPLGLASSDSFSLPASHAKNKTLRKVDNLNYSVSVWYNGMLEACMNAQEIKKELL